MNTKEADDKSSEPRTGWPTEGGKKVHWSKMFKVHPAAAVFPMLPDDELAALAEDIKQNGIQIPPVFWNDYEGDAVYLLDGRNRLQASMLAGVDCLGLVKSDFGWHANAGQYLETEDFDPVSYVISANINRRHLTKKEQADMIVAARLAGEGYNAKLARYPIKEGKGGSTKNPVREKIMDDAAKAGISERTAARALSDHQNAGKPKKPKPAPSTSAPSTSTAKATPVQTKKLTGTVSDAMFYSSWPEATAGMLIAELMKAGHDFNFVLTLAAEMGSYATAQLAKPNAADVVTPSTSNDVDVLKAENVFLKAKIAAKSHKALELAVYQFEDLIRQAAVIQANEVMNNILENAREKEKDNHELLKLARDRVRRHGGLIAKSEYDLLVKCFHPDSRPSEKTLSDAFQLFQKFKPLILRDEIVFTAYVPLPDKIDWEAAKQKVREERAAKRAAAKAAREAKAATTH